MNNTGDRNTGSYNTGNRNTGSYNAGDRNTGGYNTGDGNTGYHNTGNFNTGGYNTGNFNTGGYNTGGYNTGDGNTGYHNIGSYNAGDRNIGSYNTGNFNTGYFNTITPNKLLVFKKECERELWEKTTKPLFLHFSLNNWVCESEMTDEEKQEHEEWKTTGGYLKQLNYKEAFQQSFYALNDEERAEQVKQLKALPNFDSKIFYEISGIDIDKSLVKEMTMAEVNEALGYIVKVIDGDE